MHTARSSWCQLFECVRHFLPIEISSALHSSALTAGVGSHLDEEYSLLRSLWLMLHNLLAMARSDAMLCELISHLTMEDSMLLI